MRYVLGALTVWWCACGGPILQNAPRPNPGVVAGIAAATAGAATIASPAAAQKLQEQRRPEERAQPAGKRETVPPDVLDRLDEAKRQRDRTEESPPEE